jgi:hypothetical protein
MMPSNSLLFANSSSVQILRERRDSSQHFAAYADPATAGDMYEAAMLFVGEVLEELGERLPDHLILAPRLAKIPSIGGLRLVSPSKFLQRDVDACIDTVVWAEASSDANLRVHIKNRSDDHIAILTPKGGFEYMPKVSGSHVVSYRQSGGVVLYERGIDKRTVISETGGPTAINERFVQRRVDPLMTAWEAGYRFTT